jgi:GT2 family glycosyltransferase
MITTITVNYKTVVELGRMLESLFAHHTEGGLEVIVVENGSGDDLSALQEKYPSVHFLETKTNLGFAGGCNLSLQSAHGEFIVLLNPDIVFTQPALYQIVSAMKQNPEVGIGGISLKNLDGSQQKCVWRFPTPTDQLLILLKLHHVFPSMNAMAKWRMNDFDYLRSADVDQVMGAFFCIRREVINQIGPFDDGFFIWYEEVDFCRRAFTAGWKVRYFANISAKHKKGSSFDHVPTIQKQSVLRHSIRRYLRKHFGSGIWFLFWILEPIFYVISLMTSLVEPM